MTNGAIKERLILTLGDKVFAFNESYGMLEAEVPATENLAILTALYNDEQLQLQFLTDLTVVHYPNNTDRELMVVYHLHNLKQNFRLRIKCAISIDHPHIASITPLFKSANWQEREAYDFFGVIFEAHPNLRRIMNVDEMDYFPLRKEYPLEEQTRIDKDDSMFGR